MSDYRTVGDGSSHVLVEVGGEKIWLARSSSAYDEHLEQGIQALMTASPPVIAKPPALKVVERRLTLQKTATWEGKTRIVRHLALCQTVTSEVFE